VAQLNEACELLEVEDDELRSLAESEILILNPISAG
jgi:hypothetical protein